MRESEKKLKKFRKKRIWPSIAFFILSCTIGTLMVMLSMLVFLSYIVQSRYEACETQQKKLVRLVNRSTEKKEAYAYLSEQLALDASGLPEAFCIVGKKDQVLFSYGEQTVDLNRSSGDFYIDTKYCSQMINRNGTINPDVYRTFFKLLRKLERNGHNPFSSRVVDQAEFWMEQQLPDGSRLITKCGIELKESDVFMVGISCMGVLTLLVLLMTLQFINTLHNICSQRKMAGLIFLDPVTGGNNWLYFQNYAGKLLQKRRNRSKTYAVVDLMLMKYRNYCTLHGAAQGEVLLERMYRYIDACLKRRECCVRYGKSDFVLLLEAEPELTPAEAEQQMAKRVEQLICGIQGSISRMHANGKRLPLPERQAILFHSGIYMVEPEQYGSRNVPKTEQGEELPKKYAECIQKRQRTDISQLYNCAAMARGTIAEEAGNCVQCFTKQMWEEQLWENKVEDMMQAALEREEFQVYLQPKYHPVTEELAGAEALVRWISPTEGFISPGKFIPIFEKTGFVTQLDDYMISHVAKLQAGWLAAGKRIVPVSVNVSRAHFAQPDLAEHIRDLVDVYEVPHHYIEIELTESAFFDDKEALLYTVRKLQEYGFDVSMDDFGSGYSSLNSLKDLPLNVLKLDAEFFRGEDAGERGEIVIAEAIALAKQLDMRIVAEGVEKKEQVDFLAAQECDMIQGFYFAKPMPAVEYEERMEYMPADASEKGEVVEKEAAVAQEVEEKEAAIAQEAVEKETAAVQEET